MDDGKMTFLRRGDGFVEDGAGNFAVRMLVASITHSNLIRFRFKANMQQTDAVELQWRPGDLAQLFPEEVARSVLARGYARQCTDDELDWLAQQAGVQQAATPTDPAQPTPEELAEWQEAADSAAAAATPPPPPVGTVPVPPEIVPPVADPAPPATPAAPPAAAPVAPPATAGTPPPPPPAKKGKAATPPPPPAATTP